MRLGRPEAASESPVVLTTVNPAFSSHQKYRTGAPAALNAVFKGKPPSNPSLWRRPHDFVHAGLSLRPSHAAAQPGLTAVIVASLAIGIGANTAIFSVVNALLLKPLPYPDPDRLAVLWLRSPGINIPQDWPSPGQYIDVRNENRSFEEMSISQGRSGTLLGLEQPERVEALRTSSSLFRLLGAKPLHGRLLLPEEDVPGKPPVVILSYGFWRRMFGADPDVIGRSITLNGIAAGSGDEKNQFDGRRRAPARVPAERRDHADRRQHPADGHVPAAAVRRRRGQPPRRRELQPDGAPEAGRDHGAGEGRRQRDCRAASARRTNAIAPFTIDVVPLLDQVVGDVRRAMLVLLGSVTLVLLIACANVANLLLTRATARQKEVAIRTALGAGWQRLVRQLLTESVLLGLIGGAAGLLIARAALYIVRTVNPGQHPAARRPSRIDGTVLAFTFGVSILTGIVFGLAPALRAARPDLNTSLKAGGRNTQGDGGFGTSRRRLRSLLVVSEVAFSLMLLVGAGLLIRSFVRLQKCLAGLQSRERDLDAARARAGVSSRIATPPSSTSGSSATRSRACLA